MYDDVRIVLVNTSHPGNIGAVARAMKTSNFSQLYLVQPKNFPCAEASARASGAVDVLQNAIVTETLDEALEGVSYAFATSTRARSLAWPHGAPKQFVETFSQALLDPSSSKAIVFGRESTGLTNDELQRCQYHINIPTNTEYSSLNLAAAVQVICYELNCHLSDGRMSNEMMLPESSADDVAHREDVERFYQHLNQVLIDIYFIDPNNPRLVMNRLRRLFARTQLEKTEINILRGILKAVQQTVK